MNTDKTHIYTIISSHLTKGITKKDTAILNEWLNESHKNQQEFDDLNKLWHKAGEFQFPERIETKKALSQIHKKGNIKQQRSFNLSVIQQIAAILVLSIMLSGLYSYFSFKHNMVEVASYFEEVKAAYGTRTNVDLPDGSTVILNSGSSIRFSNQFGKLDERRIELQGEGFFKVAKDTERPFVVHVNQLEVKALGTVFNVNAYKPEKSIAVILLEGKVAINSQRNRYHNELMILEPSEMAYFDVVERKLYKQMVDLPEKYIGWTEGKIVFVDDPMNEVINKLENWYNVEIKFADARLEKYRFTGTFINESLDEILTVLSLTSPLKYETKPAVKNADGSYVKRKITLKMN